MRNELYPQIAKAFETVKAKEERLIWLGKPNYACFFVEHIWSGALLFSLFAVFLLLGQYLETDFGDTGDVVIYLILILFLGPYVYRYFRAFFIHAKAVYAFTNERIIVQEGLLSSQLTIVDFDKVVKVTCEEPVLGRLFKTGTIHFYLATKSGKDEEKKRIDLSWYSIDEVYTVLKKMQATREALKLDTKLIDKEKTIRFR